MRHILVATDFSERSDHAVRRVMLLAQQTEAEVTLLHVIDDDQPERIIDSERAVAKQLLDEQASALNDIGVRCDSSVVIGAVSAGITGAVAHRSSDLIAIGAHRRRALRDVFVGTTAERTIRATSCPVLMVNAPAAGPYTHAMLTTDLSAESAEAVKAFDSLGLSPFVDLSLLHVFDAPALRLVMSHATGDEGKKALLDDARDAARNELAEFARSAGGPGKQQVLRHQSARIAADIRAAADELSADLIVVGTRGATALRRLFLGSVAEEVLRAADRDVLAIPPA